MTSQPTDNDDFGPIPDVEKENLPVDPIRGSSLVGDSYRQDFLGTTFNSKLIFTSSYNNNCHSLFVINLDAPTPNSVKRQAGRKRKAAVDLEAEAEEHQKRREAQYQSLLAPTSIAQSMQSTMPGNDHSLPQYPLSSLSDVQLSQSIERQPEMPAFGDVSGRMSGMENMGYDQVKELYFYQCVIYNVIIIFSKFLEHDKCWYGS